MWRELDAPGWMEVVVELSRVVLLALIVAHLEKTPIRRLLHKSFLVEIRKRCAAYLKRSWLHPLAAQIEQSAADGYAECGEHGAHRTRATASA
jgi:hypothetical protein